MATSYMLLDLPVVDSTDPPDWGDMLVEAFETIDEHNHTSGRGVRVPVAGMNVDADLSFNGNDAYSMGRLGLTQLAAAIVTTNSFYDVNGDIYWNDASGNSIRITNAGALNVAGSGGIGGDYGSGSSSVTYSATTKTYTFTDDGGNEGNIDCRMLDSSGRRYLSSSKVSSDTVITTTDDRHVVFVDSSALSAITLTLPAASDGSRDLIVQDIGGASDIVLTIAPAGSDTVQGLATDVSITVPYGGMRLVSDGTSAWWIV